MELQLHKQSLKCLRTALRELLSQEQTQEIRVSDGMPDIGCIIGAWGQVILRGKEWDAGTVRVSGGTMVWVQYLSEDGEETATVESWLPFQMQWNVPASEYDGTILCQSFLKSVDARSTSARKMMLRTGIAVLSEGVAPWEYDVFSPENLPEDVQILTERYPVELPVEAGEKAFTLEESLPLPAENSGISKMISYHLQPEVTEEKLMGDKLVFRGKAWLHVHYCSDDGTQNCFDQEIPFSQYCELNNEYGQSDTVRIWPCITSLEAELQQNQIHVKAGLVCQYRICSGSVLEVVTDAYSNRREVECVRQDLEIPAILETKSRTLPAKVCCGGDGIRMADVRFLLHPVSVQNHGETAEITLSGVFQSLYYDMEGKLHAADQPWKDTISLPLGENISVEATAQVTGKTQDTMMAGAGHMQAQTELQIQSHRDSGIAMISALTLGEIKEPDSGRPSLILRRAGEQTLWELAKENGSTVALIQATNDLQTEPDQNQMLLIPVI